MSVFYEHLRIVSYLILGHQLFNNLLGASQVTNCLLCHGWVHARKAIDLIKLQDQLILRDVEDCNTFESFHKLKSVLSVRNASLDFL